MADDDLAGMVIELAAKCTAHELILLDLIHDAWPLETHRIERRESTCSALERQIERTDPSSHVHLHLQRVLAEVESVFGRAEQPPSG